MLFGAALGEYVWTVVADAATPRRRAGGRRCVTCSASAACGAAGRAQGPLRRRHRRRRLARARDRVLPAPARHHRRRRAREELHRLAARRGATRRSCARTTRPRRARASTTPASSSTRGSRAELDFNLLFSQCGHLTLAHGDRAAFVMADRAEVNRLMGIDSRFIGPEEVKRLAPAMDVSPDATYPIVGALYHPPGGIIRHDAVVWGFARGADAGGAEIHPYTEVTGLRAHQRPHRPPCARAAGRSRPASCSTAPPAGAR